MGRFIFAVVAVCAFITPVQAHQRYHRVYRQPDAAPAVRYRSNTGEIVAHPAGKYFTCERL